ncbi:alcohol dehydrogenase class IV [Variovorax guangxiensis]|nr:alcohol dehydrogenase class IV [Variovorax guangxiensis]
MKAFTYASHAQRILFGEGMLDRLGAEVDALGATHAMVLSTPGQRAEAEPEGIASLGRALPLLTTGDVAQASAGRSEALYGAWLCGTVLGSVSMALHHKLCHTLGGSFNLPHAETHAIVLPHALAYNANVVPQSHGADRESPRRNQRGAERL